MKAKNLVTAHYVVRARQRGYRAEDLAIVETLGTLRGDGILLRSKDVAPEIERLSAALQRMRRHKGNGNFHGLEIEAEKRQTAREIERLQRLPGAFIPTECGHALSIYRPCKRRLKHILRGGRRLVQDRRSYRK
jgi:hypothetical protein